MAFDRQPDRYFGLFEVPIAWSWQVPPTERQKDVLQDGFWGVAELGSRHIFGLSDDLLAGKPDSRISVDKICLTEDQSCLVLI